MKNNYIIIYVYFRQPEAEDCPYSAIGKCPFEKEEEYYYSLS